jgi:hypothetical protein
MALSTWMPLQHPEKSSFPYALRMMKDVIIRSTQLYRQQSHVV